MAFKEIIFGAVNTVVLMGATPLQAQFAHSSALHDTIMQPVTIEIWSDVMCPFCYIGKRKFERALAQFSGKDSVQVIWRSFQLDPDLHTDTTLSVSESLSQKKGWSPEQTAEMTAYVTRMAEQVGLEYHFDRAVVANSFDAHQLTHYARRQGKQAEVEERLFAAYFTEGKNIDDPDVLAEIAQSTGLDPVAVKVALASDEYAESVRGDIELARQFGINSVPFFVFNRQYAVSGAQDVEVFLSTLQKIQTE